jgi:DNA-binding transcriptional regulator YdaS (Cro superfamily)
MNSAPNELVLKAIALCGGSEAKLAAATHVTQPAIHKLKRAERVSAEMAVRIEEATQGEVPRWKLRPDLWAAPHDEDAA